MIPFPTSPCRLPRTPCPTNSNMLGKAGRRECEKLLFWDSGGLNADLESSQGMGVAVGGYCGVMGEGLH